MVATLVRALLFHSMLPSSTPIRVTEENLFVGEQEDEGRVGAFEKAVEEGASLASSMTCSTLVTQMTSEVENAGAMLSAFYADPKDQTKEDAVVLSSDKLMAFAQEADDRRCLPKVMLEEVTQTKIKDLLDKHLKDTLLSKDLKSEWCHDGIRHESSWGFLTCCSKECGVCDEKEERSVGPNGRNQWIYLCKNRTGGANSCCPETIRSGANCEERQDTACRIPNEENPANLLKRAYGKLLAWQQGTYELASKSLSRAALFPDDIEENCPKPCGMCSKSHNSWRKGEELFKFKCLLQAGQPPPSEEHFVCSEPARRRSFWRPHRWGRKTWCEVPDWKESTCIQLKVSALASCGAGVVLSELSTRPALWSGYRWHGGDYFAEADYVDCVEKEMGLKQYGWQRGKDRSKHMTREILAGFNLIMTLGFINGLAALRDESNDPTGRAKGALLDPFVQEHEVDVQLQDMFSLAKLPSGAIPDQQRFSCDKHFLETCMPQWKMKIDRWSARVKQFISLFLIHGFWATFWGGLSFFSNTLLLAAIGASTVAGLGLAYIAVTTTVAVAFGLAFGLLHCLDFPRIGHGGQGSERKVSWCSWYDKEEEQCGKYSFSEHRKPGQSWTDLIEKTRKEVLDNELLAP